MKHSLKYSLLAGMTGVLLSTGLQAQGYAFLETGSSSADLSADGFRQAVDIWMQAPDATGGSIHREDDDRVLRVGGGLDINPHLGVELLYESLGSYGVGMRLDGVNPDGKAAFLKAGERVELKGLGTRLVGRYPFTERMSVEGMAGVSYLDRSGSNSVERQNFGTGVDAGEATDDSNDWSVSFGIGARFDISGRVAVNARYTRYLDAVEGPNISASDLDALSVGLVLRW